MPQVAAERIFVTDVAPQVDCGRWPAKACVGDRVEVGATITRDGHEALRGVVRYRRPKGRWRESPLEALGNDRFAGGFEVDAVGRWRFEIEAWVDRHAGWLDEHDRKVAAGQSDLAGELAEGAALFGPGTVDEWRAAAAALGAGDRGEATRSGPLEVEVERQRARAGAWYELFPRSWGGLAGVTRVVPELAELGFDVVYLPPIHPIGRTNRKGRNNAERAEPGDVGSPWAIGAAEGGHDAIDPGLGDDADLAGLVGALREHGMELALDLALQMSPDHPWLAEHPEWFQHRPDGTLKYAENPPKRYQDIHNLDWETADRKGLWNADPRRRAPLVRRGGDGLPGRQPAHEARPVLGVADRGGPQAPSRDRVPLGGVHAPRDDDAAREGRLLAVVHLLHLEEHEVRARRARRAAARVVTVPPPEPLAEHAGHPPRVPPARRPARVRVPPRARGDALAELRRSTRATRRARTSRCGRAARSTWTRRSTRLKERRLDGPLLPLIRRLNEVRRAHPALTDAGLEHLTWLETESEHLVGYARTLGDDAVLVVVNLDPSAAHEGVCVVPPALGLGDPVPVVDALGGGAYSWGARNYVRLGPGQAHVMEVQRA